jgi:nucleotide-binding universal stress UspA family protein
MRKSNFHNILVPIDFSKRSIQALSAATNLARHWNARVHLLHIFEMMHPVDFGALAPLVIGELPTVQEESERTQRERLRQLAARAGLSPKNCHISCHQPIWDGICQFARIKNVDLIVTSTHGFTGLKHVLLGSTAERVVQHSPCPVFVSRPAAQKIRQILVPVDFSGCSFEALKYAIEFAEKVTAEIIILHALDVGCTYSTDGYAIYGRPEIEEALRQEAESTMRDFIHAADFGSVHFRTAVRVGSPVDEICCLAKAEHVDLIVTATHGRTGFKHVLIGSIAEKLVRHADRPVLVVPSDRGIRSSRLTDRGPAHQIRCGLRNHRLYHKEPTSMARRHREPLMHPFPERRKTNKFRESHLKP